MVGSRGNSEGGGESIIRGSGKKKSGAMPALNQLNEIYHRKVGACARNPRGEKGEV